MDLINIENVERFISKGVGVSIYDDSWADQSPLQSKVVHKVEICPRDTHLRIYFDKKNFVAVPRTSEVVITETSWTAIDEETGLHYVIKSEL